jgi:hypothetical protein
MVQSFFSAGSETLQFTMTLEALQLYLIWLSFFLSNPKGSLYQWWVVHCYYLAWHCLISQSLLVSEVCAVICLSSSSVFVVGV